MSTLQNEEILNGLYWDFMEELKDSGDLPMYSEDEIREIVYERFLSITC